MADAHTGMGPLTPAPKLNPNCQCICHTQPGMMHVAACCTAPDLIPRADAELAVAEAFRWAADMIEDNVRHAKELGREIWAMPDLLALVPADALAEVQRMREERDAALAQMKKLRDAGLGLKSILEGIQGAMEHETWRAERSNLRMKDTEEWMTFYNVMTALDEDARDAKG